MNTILDNLRQIDELFGSCTGVLKYFPHFPIRRSDVLILNFIIKLFHWFLMEIQKHYMEDVND
jgi:hypothetical protein